MLPEGAALFTAVEARQEQKKTVFLSLFDKITTLSFHVSSLTRQEFIHEEIILLHWFCSMRAELTSHWTVLMTFTTWQDCFLTCYLKENTQNVTPNRKEGTQENVGLKLVLPLGSQTSIVIAVKT